MAVNKIKIENLVSPVDVKITKPDSSTVNIAQGNSVDLTLTVGSSEQLVCEQDPAGATQTTVRVTNSPEKGSTIGTLTVTETDSTVTNIATDQVVDFVLEGSDTLVIETV